MSYSFGATGANKAELKLAVRVQFASVVQSQPVHAMDVPEVAAAADALIDKLPDGKPCTASCNGSIWHDGNGVRSLSATINVSTTE